MTTFIIERKQNYYIVKPLGSIYKHIILRRNGAISYVLNKGVHADEHNTENFYKLVALAKEQIRKEKQLARQARTVIIVGALIFCATALGCVYVLLQP